MFAALAAIAAASDVATRRIPNWLSVPLLAGGVAAQATLGMWSALSGLAAALLLGVVLSPLWYTRRLGGGDLKFAVGAAAWVGVGGLPRYVLLSALAAGMLGLASLWASRADARASIVANLRAFAGGAGIAPPIGAVHGRVPVAAGAAFAFGAAWILGGG
jgi:prepilin peptidase CpaA